MKYNSYSGFTLTEVLTGMSIGLVLILGSTRFFLHGQRTAALYEMQNRIQENILFAANEIGHDLRMAGYLGINSHSGSIIKTPGAEVSCRGNNITIWALNLEEPLTFSNDHYTIPCGPEKQPAGWSDTLTLRYATATTFPPDDNHLQLLTDRYRGYLHSDASPDSGGLVSPQNHLFVLHSYYIATDTASGEPELRRWALSTHGRLVNELVTEGISDLQLEFSGSDEAAGNWSEQYTPEAKWVRITITGTGRLQDDDFRLHITRPVRLRNMSTS